VRKKSGERGQGKEKRGEERAKGRKEKEGKKRGVQGFTKYFSVQPGGSFVRYKGRTSRVKGGRGGSRLYHGEEREERTQLTFMRGGGLI